MFHAHVKGVSERSELTPCIYNNIILILDLSVSLYVTGRSTEAIRPALKSFLSLHRWTWTLQQAVH